jgi:PHP family Zn ribbon phosphoesterase
VVIRADLHIHSCLSPCGDLSMSPAFIARRAASLGFDLIALTDHNSALNAPAFAEACRSEGLTALFGIEVTTAEEAHVLAIFETPQQAIDLAERLYQDVTPRLNDPVRLGDQVYVNAQDEILGAVEHYLGSASGAGLEILEGLVLDAGGLFIPSHIDRPFFSIPSQLGFLPLLRYSALEVCREPGPGDCLAWRISGDVPFIASSDAHYPADLGRRRIEFQGRQAGFAGLYRALAGGGVRVCF